MWMGRAVILMEIDDAATLTADAFERRFVTPDEFVADPAAFVDVRIPRSRGKASYSFIGPGVSQNAAQHVNLPEAHGFHVGAATMPAGVVNNPHMHFTAEVFVCTRGAFRMLIGEHEDQHLELRPGDVFSAPTWIFRGFENIGTDDGWLFVILGQDDTGGILWSPQVLRDAAATGLYLRTDQSLLDTEAGDTLVSEDIVGPMSEHDLSHLDAYSDEALADHVIGREDGQFSPRALLSAVVDDHEVELAPVIGYGMTEDRRQQPPLPRPLGFTVEWLRVSPGSSTGWHRHDGSQVLILADPGWELAVNGPDAELNRQVPADTIASIPAGVWRDLRNVGTEPAYALVINGGDTRTRLQWHPQVETAALAAGWTRDAYGYLAPRHLVRR